MLIFIGSGPTFFNVVGNNIIDPLQSYWWAILFFVQNLLPWTDLPGLYWMYYVSNDLQFYAIVMMPSVYMYLSRTKRWLVLSYLSLLILFSMSYLFYVSLTYKFSSMLTIQDNTMFDAIYRRPFGPIGYYSLGILLSIFYFEYSQAISNRELRKRNAYRFMIYVGKTKTRVLIMQLIGAFFLIFVVFIRYSSFCGIDVKRVDSGRWPIFINALFNAFAPYFFIVALVLLFLPIFMGKLSIIRDLFAS